MLRLINGNSEYSFSLLDNSLEIILKSCENIAVIMWFNVVEIKYAIEIVHGLCRIKA